MKMFIQLCVVMVVLTLIVSCDKHNEESDYYSNLPKVREYSVTTMFYPTVYPISDTNKVVIEYNESGEITQRIGNLILGYKLYKYIGDTVVYYSDSIVIEKNFLPGSEFTGFVYPNKRKLFLENGLIVKSINNLDYYSYDLDTTIYQYNKKKQIINTIQTIRDGRSTKKYSEYNYDDNGNLILVTSEEYKKRYGSDGEYELTSYDTAWFGDYDESPNLLKNLIIFQECYYRAISENNFRQYTYKEYSVPELTIIGSQYRSWEFEYDENNYPIY